MTRATAPLLSTADLAAALGDPATLVIDATVFLTEHGPVTGHEEYIATGHIPGAVFADLLEEFSDPEAKLRFTKPTAEQFAAAASALGIAEGRRVVVYDAAIGQWAARFWWLLRSFGFEGASVLDGGLTKWRAEGREVEVGHVEPAAADFVAVERPELWASQAEVARVAAGEADAALICALPTADFTGEAGARPRKGRIPGSTSVPAGSLLDKERGGLLDAESLRARFGDAAGRGRTILYCAAGVSAALDALALTVAGATDVAIYDGSLNEWSADPALPLVTG